MRIFVVTNFFHEIKRIIYYLQYFDYISFITGSHSGNYQGGNRNNNTNNNNNSNNGQRSLPPRLQRGGMPGNVTVNNRGGRHNSNFMNSHPPSTQYQQIPFHSPFISQYEGKPLYQITTKPNSETFISPVSLISDFFC